MKKILAILLPTLLLASCQPKKSALQQVYDQYADSVDRVTVALVGNYRVEDNIFNVIMLQALSDDDWQWLKEEFGVIQTNNMPMPFANELIDYPKMQLQFISNYVDSTGRTEDPLANTDEGTIVTQFLNTLLQNIIDIDSAEARLNFDSIVCTTDSIEATIDTTLTRRFSQMAAQEGKYGYLIVTQEQYQTLWLLFFDSLEEMLAIARHLMRNDQTQFMLAPQTIADSTQSRP